MADSYVRLTDRDARILLLLAEKLGNPSRTPGPAEQLLRRIVADHEQAPELDHAPIRELDPHDVDLVLPQALDLLEQEGGWADAELVDTRLGPAAVGALLRHSVSSDQVECQGGFVLATGRRRR